MTGETMKNKPLYNMTISQLTARLQAGRISAEQLTALYLKRIRQYDKPKGLNSVARINAQAEEQARQLDETGYDSRKPLFGIPVLVKDNIDVKGMVTAAGSLALGDNVAAQDAPVIVHLRQSGAVILGKTNMTEFANYTTQGMPNGYSSAGGQVHNAYDAKSDPGGSSSGSAVAVSAGLAAGAIGTDTSFSVVGCATHNGIAGLKPAYQALPQNGIVPIAHTLDSAGSLGRCFEDALLLYQAMKGCTAQTLAPLSAGQLKLAVNSFNHEKVSPDQRAAYRRLLARLQTAGASIEQVSQDNQAGLKDIMRCEFKTDLEKYLAAGSCSLKTLAGIIAFYNQHPAETMKYGISCLQQAQLSSTDDTAYQQAIALRHQLQADLGKQLAGYDACLMAGQCNIMHFLGWPSVALPLGMTKQKTPRGLILYGPDETRLYRAALTIAACCRPFCPPVLD